MLAAWPTGHPAAAAARVVLHSACQAGAGAGCICLAQGGTHLLAVNAWRAQGLLLLQVVKYSSQIKLLLVGWDCVGSFLLDRLVCCACRLIPVLITTA